MKSEKLLRKFVQNDLDSLVNKPNKRMKQFQKYLPQPDKLLMRENPDYGWEFIKGSIESYKQGIDGVVQEWKLYVKDWQIDLTTIESPVSLWYGSEDKMAPKLRGIYYRNKLQNSTLHLIDNEGHFSLIRNHLEDILIELTHTQNKTH